MSTDRNDQWVPPGVRKIVNEIVAGTCCDAEITSSRTGDWYVTLSNDRVRATGRFRRSSGGKYKIIEGALFIDGQPRPTSEDSQHLINIFNDPDGATAPSATLNPMPPERPITEAPASAQVCYASLVRAFTSLELTPRVGATDRRWVIRFQNGTATIQVTFNRKKNGGWRDAMRVIAGGRDVTREINGDAQKMLALLAGEDVAQPGQAPPAVGHAAPATGYGSVGVRRNAVIRV